MNILELFTMVISATTPNELAVENTVTPLAAPELIWVSERENKQKNELSITLVDKKKNTGIRILNKNKMNFDIKPISKT
ncbi:MAG: hypothetical protein HRT53_17885 [Colwellia sp.]|nr:hypothetical protein [Colwellia sp.]